jgi:hypothetical protein
MPYYYHVCVFARRAWAVMILEGPSSLWREVALDSALHLHCHDEDYALANITPFFFDAGISWIMRENKASLGCRDYGTECTRVVGRPLSDEHRMLLLAYSLQQVGSLPDPCEFPRCLVLSMH